MAVEKDFTIVRGDTKLLPLKFLDKNKTPINITGYKFYVTVKENIDDPDEQAVYTFDYTCPDNEDSQNGVVILKIDTSQMSSDKTYYYDIQMKDPADVVRTLLIGKLLLKKDVTRRV